MGQKTNGMSTHICGKHTGVVKRMYVCLCVCNSAKVDIMFANLYIYKRNGRGSAR